MILTRRVLFALSALLFLLPGALAGAQAYTSIVVFGDSLSDTGNDATLSAAKYTVNGQVPGPATGYTNGRFTDGTDTLPAARNFNGVWIEQLAAMFAAHPVVKNSLAGGTNYAYGFATTDVGTTVFAYGPGNVFTFVVNNMGKQVSDYLATNPTITNKTLFIVWGGANDLINATSSADIAAAAAREAAIVQTLINAGATDILVPNLPPLGLVPRFNGSAATSIPATQGATGFDQALAGYLAAIPAQNPTKTLHLFQFDVYTLFNTIVASPTAAGFMNVTASSQGNASVNPDMYLFWDDLHPTTAGHSRVAAAADVLLGAPVATTTVVTSNNANANLSASVTLTATVTGTTGTPMGTVTFMDGANILGSSVVTGTGPTATATYTTTAFAAGTHNVTAQFSGVNGYSGSTSAAFTETVTAPALKLAFVTNSISIASGQSGTAMLNVQPVGGYSGTATIACGSPLPAHFSCSVSPATATLAGNVVVPAQVTIGTSAPQSALLHLERPGANGVEQIALAFGLFPMLGLLGVGAVSRHRGGLQRMALTVLLAAGCGVCAVGMTGCSSAPSNNAAPGTYTVPIVVTANGTTTTANLTVVVM